MGNEVLWSRYLDELRVKRPEGVRFTSVSLIPTGAAAASSGATAGSSAGSTAAGSAPAAPGGIAALTLSGKARSQPDVAALLDQLAQIKGFTSVYLTSTAADTQSGLVTYSVSASVTPEALSHRYTGDGN
jgi:Tfp pilus assembly protein PilN